MALGDLGMGETLAMRVARALRQAQKARVASEGSESNVASPRAGDESGVNDHEIASARAAIETCFDDIWSDGYVVGAKFGSAGMSAELLRAAAKEQILSRPLEPSGPQTDGVRPADNPIARAEATLRQLLEQSRNRRS